MYLSELTLTNIRQFAHRTFHFSPGFNLVVGENGAGKTTILRGILATLGKAKQLGRAPLLNDEDVRLHTRHAEAQATIVSTNRNTRRFFYRKPLWEKSERSRARKFLPLVLHYASNEATCSGMKVKRRKRYNGGEYDELRRSEEFLYERETRAESAYSSEASTRFGNSRSIREFIGTLLGSFSQEFLGFYWRFEPYDCRLIPPEKIVESREQIQLRVQAQAFAMRFLEQEWPETRSGARGWPDQALVTLDAQSRSRTPERSYLPDSREIWEGMRLSADARAFIESCALEIKLTPRIMIERPIGALRLSQLSDGEQRLFSLIIDIARQLSLQNPEDNIGNGSAIILIDEIDVHLHPKWQRQITATLEQLFVKCQFIATTHSSFVIQAVSREKITSINNEEIPSLLETGNSIEDIAETIQGISMPQRSRRAETLGIAAERYFRLLADQKNASTDEIDEAERAYREATEPFTGDPAVHALLKVQQAERKFK